MKAPGTIKGRQGMWLGLAFGLLFAMVATILTAILEQAEENGRLAEDAHVTAEYIADCQTPGTMCYERGTEVAAAAAARLEKFNLRASAASAICVQTRPPFVSELMLAKCVVSKSAELLAAEKAGKLQFELEAEQENG